MAQYNLKTAFRTLLADTATPVNIYLRVRDEFPNSILLESSDYHVRGNSMSFICCDPIAHIKIEKGVLEEQFPDGSRNSYKCDEVDIPEKISNFSNAFRLEANGNFSFTAGGLYGYFT
ncbi:MAG TPA: anthranilate synthase component I family protein, partial [Anseongella sp.]|nr:anthranilate synthase component I family protein [Anseongella sp.]